MKPKTIRLSGVTVEQTPGGMYLAACIYKGYRRTGWGDTKRSAKNALRETIRQSKDD